MRVTAVRNLLLALTGATLLPAVASPTSAVPRCPYANVRADTREVLLRIDQELLRSVAATRAELRSRGEENYLPTIWLDSCFSQVPLEKAYSQNPFFAKKYTAALRRQLTHYYSKPLAHEQDFPQWMGVQVLEYATDEAAAQHLQDSTVAALQARCKYRDHKLEPCVLIEKYRVSRRRNCLVRSSAYSQDPMRQSAMNWVLANLRY